MFRTAVLRSAAAVSRIVARPLATTTRSAVVAPRIASAFAPASRIVAVPAVRMYSAPAGTSREDVESRIMSILAGFDKVSLSHFYIYYIEAIRGNPRGWNHLHASF